MSRLSLPATNKETIDACAQEAASAHGKDEAAEFSTTLKLAWALAHSERGEVDARRAIEMLSGLRERERRRGSSESRELCYLLAVAHYRLADYAAAKAWCERALKAANGTCRQSTALLKECETLLAEDALIGIAGVGAVLAGVVLLGAALLGGGGSSRSRGR